MSFCNILRLLLLRKESCLPAFSLLLPKESCLPAFSLLLPKEYGSDVSGHFRAPSEAGLFSCCFCSPSEGEELQYARERCLWPYIPSYCPSPTFGRWAVFRLFLRTFGRWAAFRLFPLTFGRWDFTGLLANALRTVVARSCIFPLPAHLWKVRHFAVVSAHLRKVRNCSMSARGACGRTSHRIVPLPPSEGGLLSGCFCSPSEGGRGGRAPFPVSEFF